MTTRSITSHFAAWVLLASYCVTGFADPPPQVEYPQWWLDYGLVGEQPPADTESPEFDEWMAQNYAPANLGQLKNVATQARNFLDQRLQSVGGAGPEINALVNSFLASVPEAPNLNYQPVNLGQLKAVATPFYDRLNAVNSTVTAPWTATTSPALNYAPANLGQLKNVFSFDLGDLFEPEPPPAPLAAPAQLLVDNLNRDEDPAESGPLYLAWTPVSGTNITYEVQRRQIPYAGAGQTLGWATITLAAAPELVGELLKSRDAGVNHNHRYRYRIRARDDEGAYSDWRQSTPPEYVRPIPPGTGGGLPSDPGPPAGGEDPDGDGLTTDEELHGGTNPTSSDSDFDGLDDGVDAIAYDSDFNFARIPDNLGYAEAYDYGSLGASEVLSVSDNGAVLLWDGEDYFLGTGGVLDPLESEDEIGNVTVYYNWSRVVGYGEDVWVLGWRSTSADASDFPIVWHVGDEDYTYLEYEDIDGEIVGSAYFVYAAGITGAGEFFFEVMHSDGCVENLDYLSWMRCGIDLTLTVDADVLVEYEEGQNETVELHFHLAERVDEYGDVHSMGITRELRFESPSPTAEPVLASMTTRLYMNGSRVPETFAYITGPFPELVGGDLWWYVQAADYFAVWGDTAVYAYGEEAAQTVAYQRGGMGRKNLPVAPGVTGANAKFWGVMNSGVAIVEFQDEGQLWYNGAYWDVLDGYDLLMMTAEGTIVALDGGDLVVLMPDWVFPEPADSPLAISPDEVAGARYRKIALNGRPLGDGKPQTEAETDQAREETFIDALTLGLRHTVSDIYATIPGSDLTLSVSRVYQEEIWQGERGQYIHQRRDLPFGPGWRTNILPNVRLERSNADSDLIHAYVTDETGNEYHFVGGADSTPNFSPNWSFVPYPTGRHEKGAYQTSLIYGGANTLVFQKKFGTKVTYQLAYVDADVPTNRNNVAAPKDTWSFFRATEVADPLGYKLVFNYGGNATALLPANITAMHPGGSAIPNLKLTIAANGTYPFLIDSITDGDGRATAYTYTAHGSSWGNSTLRQLTNVEDAASASVAYAYEPVQEADWVDWDSSPPQDFLHFSLASITDQNTNVYSFGYVYHYGLAAGEVDETTNNSNATKGVQIYNSDALSNGGYYAPTGRSRLVKTVTLPALTGGNASPVQFTDNSFVRIMLLPNGQPVLAGNWTRQVSVTDARGKTVGYSWSAPSLRRRPAPSWEAGSSLAYMLIFETMAIDYGSLGREAYSFQFNAGMALKSATDVNGNEVAYEYSDPLNNSPPPGFPQALFGYYDDPTAQVNALGGRKEFTYNEQRRMTEIVDELGRKTVMDVDAFGRRLAEKRFASGGGIPVQWESFEYGNTTFPGMVTKTTNRLLGTAHPGATNLVVTHVLMESNQPGAGRIKETHVDPDDLDLTTAYTYSNTGDLLTQTDARGNLTTFAYDARHRLVSTTYGSGNATTARTYGYDDRGNKIRETDENGHSTLWEYDNWNRVIRTGRYFGDTEPAELTGGDLDNGTDLVTRFEYNFTGARTKVTNPRGDVTNFGYDDYNRLIEMVLVDAPANGGVANVTTQYQYEPSQNPGGSVFDSSSHKPTRITDPRGFATYIQYDDLYRPVSEQVQYGGGGVALTIKEYDAAGNLVNVTDPLGTVTHTVFDALNRPTNITAAHGVAGLAATTQTFYASTGLVYRQIDAMGRETHTGYDAAGRATSLTVAAGTADEAVTETEYDANGNVAGVTNPLSQEWTYQYDSRNRRTVETQPEVANWGDGGTGTPLVAPQITTAYDPAGNVISVTDARGNLTKTFHDKADRPTHVFGPEVGYWNGTGVLASRYPFTMTEYDKAGNPIEITQGMATAQDPDPGNIDGAMLATTNAYGDHGRLQSTTDAANITVSYDYDASGNRQRVTDGLGHNTTFTYDGLNRLLVTRDHNSTAYETLAYDAMNKISRVDGRGIETTYTYDARHRLVGVAYDYNSVTPPDWAAASRAYAYDAVGNVLAVAETTFSNTTGPGVAYAYDNLNRTVKEAQGVALTGNIGNVTANGTNLPTNITTGFVNAYTYDDAGNRLTATYGVGRGDVRTLTSEYDNVNRLKVVREDGWARSVHYRYNKTGGRVGLLQQVANSTVSSVATTFDALGRQAGVTGTGAGNATMYDYDLFYDKFGNVGRQQETYIGGWATSRNVTLTYDAANRLTVELAEPSGGDPVETFYGYDDANNRQSRRIEVDSVVTEARVYEYNALNQLQAVYDDLNENGVYDYETDTLWGYYTYDGAGSRDLAVTENVTVSQTYFYDAENRLVQLTQYDGVYQEYGYQYDYRTRRVARVEDVDGFGSGDPEVPTAVVFSGGTSVREYEDDAPMAGNTTAEFVRGSDWGGGVGGILYSLRPSGNTTLTKFYHYDGRGDVTTQSNITGNVTYQAAYEAFGRHSAGEHPAAEEVGANPDRFRANTKEEDPTGLLNEGFRYRDLDTGTFITRDPMGMVDGPNLYTYVNQNPWTKFDPEGLFWDTLLDVAEVAAGAVRGVYHAGATAVNYTRAAAAEKRGDYAAAAKYYAAAAQSADKGSAAAADTAIAAACVAVPGVPAAAVNNGRRVARAAAAAANAAEATVDAARATKAADNAVDGARAVDKTADASAAANKVDNAADATKAENAAASAPPDPPSAPAAKGDELSPSNYPAADPDMSVPPVRYEPTSIDEVVRMRQGKGPTTKATHGTDNIEAHHRQQVPVSQGGVIDELTQQTHRGPGAHGRHSQPSRLTPAERSKEIREHYKSRGAEYLLPGEGI